VQWSGPGGPPCTWRRTFSPSVNPWARASSCNPPPLIRASKPSSPKLPSPASAKRPYDYAGLRKYPWLGKTLSLRHLDAALSHEKLTGFPVAEVSPVKAVASRAFPVLLICDEKDVALPCRHSEMIYAAARAPNNSGSSPALSTPPPTVLNPRNSAAASSLLRRRRRKTCRQERREQEGADAAPYKRKGEEGRSRPGRDEVVFMPVQGDEGARGTRPLGGHELSCPCAGFGLLS